MTLFKRYVLLELSKVIALTLTSLTVLILVVIVGWEAVRQGLGMGPVLRLIPYALPQSLCFSVPGTVLFAACLVYGRMGAANEIIVLKSLGISPRAALWPGLTLALVLSCLGVFLNDLGFTWGHTGLQRVVVQSAEEIAYGVLRTQRTYSTERFAISVKSVEGKTLIQPTITFLGGDDETPSITITAESASLRSNLQKNTLSIYLTNSVVEVGDTVQGVFPDTIERVIPLSDASRRGVSSSPSHIPLNRIPSEVRGARQRVRDLDEAHAAEAGLSLISADFSVVSEEVWQHRRAAVAGARSHVQRLRLAPWRRTADGFSCFCFMCVGAPLALWRSRGDFMTNFFFCFGLILIVYYPLFFASLDLAKQGNAPACIVWSGNLICIFVGWRIMRRVLRN